MDLWVSAEAGQAAKDFAEFLASGECAERSRSGTAWCRRSPAAKKAAAPAVAGGKKGEVEDETPLPTLRR